MATHRDDGADYEGRRETDYEVGRDRPPKHTQFKKGKSGNQKGRPKGSLNIAASLREILSKGISIHENGKKKKIPAHQALFLQNLAKAIEGDQKAYANLLKAMKEYLPNEAKAEPETEPSEALKLAAENFRERLKAELIQELRNEIRCEILEEIEERKRGC
jgi:hypothetical protein